MNVEVDFTRRQEQIFVERGALLTSLVERKELQYAIKHDICKSTCSTLIITNMSTYTAPDFEKGTTH
jgi:hypothetical protein